MSVAAIIQKLNKDVSYKLHNNINTLCFLLCILSIITDFYVYNQTNRNNPPGLICGTDAAKVCCALSQQVDALFGDAASKLNLPALCGFLQQLCLASERQVCINQSFPRAHQNVFNDFHVKYLLYYY